MMKSDKLISEAMKILGKRGGSITSAVKSAAARSNGAEGGRPRDVYIELAGGNWFVHYVNRKKGQRYLAAQFEGKGHTREFVENWVKNQKHLRLTENENPVSKRGGRPRKDKGKHGNSLESN